MYKYVYDEQTGGILLTTDSEKLSKEPRPVYYKELDILGFDKYWNYPKDDSAPLMWSEANNYYYRGRHVAKTKGGALYTAPELILLEEPEQGGAPLKPVDIEAMTAKNADMLESLSQETIKGIYNTYVRYKDKVDLFYVAFSGGKDSVVTLDLVSRSLPHNEFMVLFGDTGMEFPDTYDVVDKVERWCAENGIRFLRAKSKFTPEESWRLFGPPSTTNRWCCSVHKTAPQIHKLREETGSPELTGMAFTGVRAGESVNRSNYEQLNLGKKHNGQMSYHTIIDWSAAELYSYIFSMNLIINNAYKSGSSRVGCLVCPNSFGKHEYIKRKLYKNKVDKLINIISLTSSKFQYSEQDMKDFIENGFWRTRKSGKELNFGEDKFEFIFTENVPKINIYLSNVTWQSWVKTIGEFSQIKDNFYTLKFRDKIYNIKCINKNNSLTLSILNYENTKADIKFLSLFRSAVIKSLYCVNCGECEAECSNNAIQQDEKILINQNCRHCLKCHMVKNSCLRYSSIRNKMEGNKKMSTLDRYFTFGVQNEWLKIFIKYKGDEEFWNSDGDRKIYNKKKDAFKNFLQDAGLVKFDKKLPGDKYTKNIPTNFANVIFKLGADNPLSWALILCNLVYTQPFNWFVKELDFDKVYNPDTIKMMLESVTPNDAKGLLKRNIITAFKITIVKTPLGKKKIFVIPIAEEKITTSGREDVILHSFTRIPWQDPDPRVILYSLYKFAEECGGTYQFTLSDLLDDEVQRDGISPTRIFGITREEMIPILNGLSVNYPDFISVSFSLDLEKISLKEDKTAEDVLAIF